MQRGDNSTERSGIKAPVNLNGWYGAQADPDARFIRTGSQPDEPARRRRISEFAAPGIKPPGIDIMMATPCTAAHAACRLALHNIGPVPGSFCSCHRNSSNHEYQS